MLQKNIWHSARLYLSDLRWLSYKLLFVRQDPSSITLGGKPSHGRSCHLETDLFSRMTDWQSSLSPSPSLFLFVSVPLSPFTITPTPCSAVCLDQSAPASDFQSISRTAPFTVVCLSVSRQSTHCWREWKLNPSGTQTDHWAFTIYIHVWTTLKEHCHPSSPSMLF